MLWWAIGAVGVLLGLSAVALPLAIARNGPAVISAVDRLTGGSQGAERQAIISTGEQPAQKLVVWGPKDQNASGPARPVIVFAHGGSWKTGDPEDYGFFARTFAPKGFTVVLVGYRLVKERAPDGVYPAMLEDTARAVQWTLENIADFGGDPAQITLVGHSAGAYNVMMTAMDRSWLEQLGSDADALRGVVGLAGPYDFYPFSSPATRDAFGQADDPLATQLATHLRADAPDALLLHGARDSVVEPRHSRDLAKQIQAAGAKATLILYPDNDHNDPLLALASPWRKSRDVAQTIAQFAARQRETQPSQ